MKDLILLAILVIAPLLSNAQNNEQVRINEIDQEISVAVSNENYEQAGKLKKEKDYRIKIVEALEKEDYETAAKIKEELEAFLNESIQNESRSSEPESTEMGKVSVTDLNLKIAALQTEEFLYGFAKGDKIVFSFSEETQKELKEIEIMKYSGSSKFKSFKTSSISDKVIEVQETGIFIFRFSNGTMSKRVCDIQLSRIPASTETAKFNTAVYWKTVYDTTYYTEQEEYLISIDTSFSDIYSSTPQISSKNALNGNKNYQVIDFILPKNTASWSFYIGSGDKGEKEFENSRTKFLESSAALASKIPNYGVMAALALTGVSHINKVQGEDNVKYRFITNANNVALFKNGQAYMQYKQGDVINEASQMVVPLKGKVYLALINDNTFDPIKVTVKVTAMIVTENWGMRPVERISVTSREVAYLKNLEDG